MNKLKLAILPVTMSILLSPNIAYSSTHLNLRDMFIKSHKEIEYMINIRNQNYDVPEISGEVSNMPWKNDKDFLDAKEKNNTPILMAGFCAVLKNPLPGEEHNVALATKKAKGQVIKSNEVFSQNNAVGPYTKIRGFKEGASYIGGNIIMTEGGGVCKLATTLYNLSVLSNLNIVERYNHSMPINYVPYGQDATVAYGVKDFKFKNITNSNILIWSEMIGNRLYMGFYGTEKPPKVEWFHESSNIVAPPVKYTKNPDLAPGEMKVTLNGLEGATVKSIVKVYYEDSHYEIKNMGISQYKPLPKLIETN